MFSRQTFLVWIGLMLLSGMFLMGQQTWPPQQQCTTPAQCDDKNPCTDDACVSGVCQHTNNTASCDDGNVCTTGDTCSGGVCAGTPVNCDDGNACTTDSCDSVTGCVHQCNATGPGDPCCSDPACAGSSACVHHVSLPDTGITKCYDNGQQITCPSPGQPFYGQDAQYTTNPMSFADNGNGTVTDNVTGLMWQQQNDGMTRNWTDAGTYCDSLSLGGYTDWRLPNERELQGIVNYGRYNPAIDPVYFPNTIYWYWSSSAYAYSTIYAWLVDFSNGYVDNGNKTDTYYVRCVRGEAGGRSFTDNGDGTVSDNTTGLMWQQMDDGVVRTWEDALGYCEDLTLAGHSDWRLPDIKELNSIVDNTRYDPAIDTTFFPGTQSNVWSSSTSAYYTLYTLSAWYVDFGYGGVFYSNMPFTLYVRCVR